MNSLIKQFLESSHISGGNASFVEELYERYLVDPTSVNGAWKNYFEQLGGRAAGDVPHGPIMEAVAAAAKQRRSAIVVQAPDNEAARKQGGVLKLVTAYRSRGHLHADLDPLGMAPKLPTPDLGLAFHGLSDADLNSEFSTGTFGGPERMRLRDLIAHLNATYCGPMQTLSASISPMSASGAPTRHRKYRSSPTTA